MTKLPRWLKALGVMLIFMLSMQSVNADTNKVVTLGADLSEDQKKMVLELLKVQEKEVSVIKVTNQEEKKYLSNLIDDAVIGTKAISSVLIELQDEGKGITVATSNINWVTPEMYTNALVTAGVKDAYIHAVAPFPVSGTAALTGIIKGFEKATGRTISEEEKQVANEEMVKTGEIGESIGDKDKAIIIVKESKERVVVNQEKDREDITRIIIDVARENGVELTKEQQEQLTDLLVKISQLNLKVDDIQRQIKNVQDKIEQINQTGTEVKSFLQQILDLLKQLIDSIAKLFGG